MRQNVRRFTGRNLIEMQLYAPRMRRIDAQTNRPSRGDIWKANQRTNKLRENLFSAMDVIWIDGGRPSEGTRSRWRAARGEGGTWRPSQGERLRLHSDWVSNLTLSEARDRFSLFSVLAMPIQKKCLIRDDRDKLPHRLHPPVDQIYS